MKKLFYTSLYISLPQLALAAGGAIPHETVISQLANISILVGFIYFTQRKTIASAFKDKKESYLKSVDQASESKKAAEDKLAEVTERVNKLKDTFAAQVEDAKKNAEESYRTQLADAKNEAVRLKNMTATNLDFEVQRQIENLRIEAFQKSADMAEKKMETSMTPDQQKLWNEHFVTAKEGAH